MPIPKECDLAGKVAIVAGDGMGWTPTFASALAEAGADVAVASLGQSDIEEALQAIRVYRRRSVGIPCDLTSPDQVHSMVQRVVDEMGKVDILVNNPQLVSGKPFLQVAESEWQRAMDVNVKSAFLCCQAVVPHMVSQGWGRIINITSDLSVRGLSNAVVFCATQGAVHQLTSALALELASSNIRVSAIGAGWTGTKELPQEEAMKDPIVRYIPLRRRGHPSDFCGLLVFLASEASDNVTGHTTFIDGGLLARP